MTSDDAVRSADKRTKNTWRLEGVTPMRWLVDKMR